MHEFKIAVFAHDVVGLETVKFLLEEYPEHIACICVTDESSVVGAHLTKAGFSPERILLYDDVKAGCDGWELYSRGIEYIILAWWPYIIPKRIISVPRKGTLNFHPAYLPYNAGAHSSFWNIVEEAPFGVTIHFVDEDIDHGDIVFQRRIASSWEDTGRTLYDKARETAIHLFQESYPLIIGGDYEREKQDFSKRSFHYKKEMSDLINLDLNETYRLRDILNILRAKTFPGARDGYEGCRFCDCGEEYEITVKITRKDTPFEENHQKINEEGIQDEQDRPGGGRQPLV